MAAPFTYFLLRVWQDWASALVKSTPAGVGDWPAAANLSFAVIAVYDSTNTKDAYGIAMAAVTPSSILEGQSTSLNDKVKISWTAPRTPPHHFLVVYQAAATFDWANNATICTTTAAIGPGAVEAEVQYASAGTITGGTWTGTPTTITLNPVPDASPTQRSLAGIGADGVTYGRSFPHTACVMPDDTSTSMSPFSGLSLSVLWANTATFANRSTLLTWLEKSWPVILIDEDANTGRTYKYYHGAISGMSTLNSAYHDSGLMWNLSLLLAGVSRG